MSVAALESTRIRWRHRETGELLLGIALREDEGIRSVLPIRCEMSPLDWMPAASFLREWEAHARAPERLTVTDEILRLREEAESTHELLADLRDERHRLTEALRTLANPKVEEWEASPYVKRMADFARAALAELPGEPA